MIMKVIDTGIEIETLINWSKSYLPTGQLKGKELIRLNAPCVYGWQRGNEWLYVGYSSRGLSRVLPHKHHVLIENEIWDDDIFYLWQPDNFGIEDLKRLERTLIVVLKPRYNKNLPGRTKKGEERKRMCVRIIANKVVATIGKKKW